MKINTFNEIDVWKLAIELTLDIYNSCNLLAFKRDYSLMDQIRRAIISVSSNIVEGFERNNNKEFIRFLVIAKGSLGEVRNQLIIAYKLNYLSETQFNLLDEKSTILSYKIGSFIKYLKLNIKNNK